MILSVYRGLSYAAAPLLRSLLEKRKSRGKEHPDRIRERFGQPSRSRPAGSVAWVHAASVGEAISVLSLVNKINREYPSLSIIITTGTVTSAAIMAERLPKKNGSPIYSCRSTYLGSTFFGPLATRPGALGRIRILAQPSKGHKSTENSNCTH